MLKETCNLYYHNVTGVANFGLVNEKYGRSIGDEVLRIVANKMSEHRSKLKDGYLFQFAGDTFITICNYEQADIIEEGLVDYVKRIEKELNYINVGPLKFYNKVVPYNNDVNSAEEFYYHMYRNREEDGRYQSGYWISDILRSYNAKILDALESFEQANKLAYYDEISELQNHRAAVEFLNAISMKRNEDTVVAILFIDGDELRKYNEVSYHAGNEMIKNLSDIVKSCIREEDKVFRWLSGDEFIVVTLGQTNESIKGLAERVRGRVEEVSSEYLYPITVSIGVDMFGANDKNWNAAIDNAEKANKFAKQNGKNQVVMWEDIKDLVEKEVG